MKTFIIAILLSFYLQPSFSQNNQADTGVIKSLIAKYAESINNGDSILGAQLFSHAPEVSFIQPRRYQRGWDEISSQVYGFFSKTFSRRNLNIISEHVTVYGNVAWAEFYWVFDATFKQGNTTMQTKGRETQIWRRANNEWRLVHVHYSNMPVTGDRQGF
jgi:ketosteroid isomerase-like protein